MERESEGAAGERRPPPPSTPRRRLLRIHREGLDASVRAGIQALAPGERRGPPGGAGATSAPPGSRSRGPGPVDASPVRASLEDDPRGRRSHHLRPVLPGAGADCGGGRLSGPVRDRAQLPEGGVLHLRPRVGGARQLRARPRRPRLLERIAAGRRLRGQRHLLPGDPGHRLRDAPGRGHPLPAPGARHRDPALSPPHPDRGP